MIETYQGHRPKASGDVRAHDSAVLIGRLSLAEGVSLWPGVVLRGDYNDITVGARTNLQDGVIVHNDHEHAASIGADCVVGHRAVVHGATVGDRCLIGIGAILLNGAVIGDDCVIGAGALVAEGKQVPAGSLVLGVPGKVLRPVSDDEMVRTRRGVEQYLGYAERQLRLLKRGPDGSLESN